MSIKISLPFIHLAGMKNNLNLSLKNFVKLCLGLLITSILLSSCKRSNEQVSQGTLLGKPYKVTVGQKTELIDSIIQSTFVDIDYLFSPTDPNSVVARYNTWPYPDSLMAFVDRDALFSQVYDYIFELYHQTNGYFDPSMMPLAEARAKLMPGYELEDAVIDEMMVYCGLSEQNFKLREYQNEQGIYEKSFLEKSDPRARIDLTDFAGAYALDIIRYQLVENNIDIFRIEWNGIALNQGFENEESRYLSVTLPGSIGEQKLNIYNNVVAYLDETAVKKVLAGSLVYPSENSSAQTFVVSGTAAVSLAYAQAFSVMGPQEMQMFFEEAPERDIEVTMIFGKDGEYYAASTPGMDTLWFSDSTKEK